MTFLFDVTESVALHLIVVGGSPACDWADTHFYGQFWAQTCPKLRGADAFLPVLWDS